MKILHTADLHLGRFYKGELPVEVSNLRREELWKSFGNTIEYTRDNDIDIMLIAGDIFEREYFTLSDMNRFSEMLNILDIEVFIIAGNHDYIDEYSLIHKVNFKDNIHIFNTEKYFDVDKFNLRVHGISWKRQFEFKEELVFEVAEDKKNLLMLHGTVGEKNYFPIDMEILSKYNFDYIALGHIHKKTKIAENCYYCGSPEGLSFKELGKCGFIVIEDDIKFIENSLRSYNEVVLEIDENMSTTKILGLFKSKLENKSEDLNRVIVSGKHNNPSYILEVLRAQRDYFYVEIIDDLELNVSVDEIYSKNIDNIIGKYIEKTKDNEELLKVGLRALLEAKNEN